MKRINTFLISTFLCIAAPTDASAVIFAAAFDGPGIPSGLSATTPSGFSIQVAGGGAVFSKAAGTGNGFGVLSTEFQIIGDFSVTVDMTRDDLNGTGESGLNISFLPAYPMGFADVWSHGPGDIVGNIFVPAPPGFGTTVISDSTTNLTFKIQRTGNTLFEFFDRGAGLELISSATDVILGGPVYAQLFLGQELGNTSAHQATFDNFFIVADGFSTRIPEPATLALLLSGLWILGAGSRRVRTKPSRACVLENSTHREAEGLLSSRA
jgi:hypothetical protein